MRCSCQHEFAASPENFIGTQLFPGVALVLFNCPKCDSTRGVCLAESDEDDLPLAAE